MAFFGITSPNDPGTWEPGSVRNSREDHVTRGPSDMGSQRGSGIELTVVFSLSCTVQVVCRETSEDVLTVVLASEEGDLERCGCNGVDEKEQIWDILKVNLSVQQMGYVQQEKERNVGFRAEQLEEQHCYQLSCRRLQAKAVLGNTSSVQHMVTLRCL